MNWLTLFVVLPWVAMAGICWGLYHILLQNRRILELLETLQDDVEDVWDVTAPKGMKIGTEVPVFELPDLEGNRVSFDQFRGRRMLVVFGAPDCAFTREFAPDLAALGVDGGETGLVPLFVSKGGVEANRELVKEFGISCPVLLQDEWEVGKSWTVTGSPQAYIVDATGKNETSLVEGRNKIRALLGLPSIETAPTAAAAVVSGEGRKAAPPSANSQGANSQAGSSQGAQTGGEPIHKDGLKAGAQAPPFRLPLLAGGELSLEDYRGRRVLLVFSDPECEPCDLLAPEMERLHRAASGLAILMVSRGSTKLNREKVAEYGLTFPVAFQRDWEVSQLYRKYGLTPSGYVIDEKGVIVADMTDAGEEIFSMGTGTGAPGNEGQSA